MKDGILYKMEVEKDVIQIENDMVLKENKISDVVEVKEQDVTGGGEKGKKKDGMSEDAPMIP